MEIYLVGGAVRDALLNYPFHERDWVVVGAEPQQLLSQGFQQVGKDFPVFLHPDTKEEYALARTERKNGQGYSGFDCYSAPDVTLEDDLLRRDLTINAIAQDEQGNITDPYHGQQDLNNKLLRHVSEAFIEDPLRVLRTARFLARYSHLGFCIADETQALMQSLSDSNELLHLSRERIWKETERAMTEQSPEQYFLALQHCGALQKLFPMIEAVSDADAQLIHTAAPTLRPPQIFALLFQPSQIANLAKALKAIKVPNEFAELAELLNRHLSVLAEPSLRAEQALQIIQQCDAFRRPERFQQLLQCSQHITPNDNEQLLQQSLQRCLDIDTKAIVATGITGKAIAEELNQQRLQSINELFQHE
ncbi:MAG: tRNA nucleotidyltransferase (CCA-adding enzyme) [Pseudohongiellaceae bacterium]|jgi:tRNA nucleotidyltransferase (CCA-adding enzyme)